MVRCSIGPSYDAGWGNSLKPLTPAYVRILSLVQWNEGFWNSGLLDLEQYHFED